MQGAVSDAGRALARARVAAGQPALVDQEALVGSLEALMGLCAPGETLTLTMVVEAMDRGLPDQAGLSVNDWLGVRCPWLSRAEVGDVVVVARGLAYPAHEAIAQVATTGGVPLRRLAVLLRRLSSFLCK